ncbi:unnamed protein product [Phaeothamnion confervicola]
MDVQELVITPLERFLKDSAYLVKKCTKPNKQGKPSTSFRTAIQRLVIPPAAGAVMIVSGDLFQQTVRIHKFFHHLCLSIFLEISLTLFSPHRVHGSCASNIRRLLMYGLCRPYGQVADARLPQDPADIVNSTQRGLGEERMGDEEGFRIRNCPAAEMAAGTKENHYVKG